MDEYAQRVCAPLRSAWTEFEAGRANLLDRARLAEQASDALDNASAPLPQLLATASSELEYAYHTNERSDQLQAGPRILRPVLSRMTT